LSSEAERIRWRRNKVLELSSEGRNQHQIATVLKVGLGTVNRDLQYLRERARNNIGKYIDEILPFEYQKCLVGLDAILTKTWDIGVITITEREKLQALQIGMQAYQIKIELLSNANVIQKAVNFIDRNNEVIIDDAVS
jgi:transcriptional regulator